MNGRLSHWLIPVGLALAGWVTSAVGIYVVLTNRITALEVRGERLAVIENKLDRLIETERAR